MKTIAVSKQAISKASVVVWKGVTVAKKWPVQRSWGRNKLASSGSGSEARVAGVIWLVAQMKAELDRHRGHSRALRDMNRDPI